MNMLWSAVLYVMPKPVQSVRFGGFHPKKVTMYKNQLKGLIASRPPVQPFAFPVCVDVLFVYPFRKQDKGELLWQDMHKGDITNLRKPVEDAMNGVVVVDDSLICAGNTVKLRRNGSTGEIWIRLFSLSQEDLQTCYRSFENSYPVLSENKAVSGLAQDVLV